MISKQKHLLFLGTTSNAGKTFVTGFVGKTLKEQYSIKVCPFKAQNMSNYATVCEYNKELSIAQASQAALMGIEPKADMNPVLLKPMGNVRSQIVIRGVPSNIITPGTFYKQMDSLKAEVDIAFEALSADNEMLVIEGAGLGFELNLKNRDLANQFMMEKENVNSVLVTNIENGGVFASVLGSYQLMPKQVKKRFKGVIINDFRGDVSYFDDGRKIIESWGIPVLGVIPHINYGLDNEDCMDIMHSYEQKNKEVIHVGVIQYPRVSNINDVEPLVHDPSVQVSFISQRVYLDMFDKIILPGSRAVIDDLRWLKNTGIAEDLKHTNVDIYGICGGYQMLHNQLNDPFGTESSRAKPDNESGIGLIPANVEFMPNKILKRKDYILFEDIKVHGFEMHTGVSDKYEIFYDSPKVKGSMAHEVFHCDNFRKWWLAQNLNKQVKEWNFKSWKNSVQNGVALKFKDIIDWERLID